jgi:hypothetical protein
LVAAAVSLFCVLNLYSVGSTAAAELRADCSIHDNRIGTFFLRPSLADVRFRDAARDPLSRPQGARVPPGWHPVLLLSERGTDYLVYPCPHGFGDGHPVAPPPTTQVVRVAAGDLSDVVIVQPG